MRPARDLRLQVNRKEKAASSAGIPWESGSQFQSGEQEDASAF